MNEVLITLITFSCSATLRSWTQPRQNWNDQKRLWNKKSQRQVFFWGVRGRERQLNFSNPERFLTIILSSQRLGVQYMEIHCFPSYLVIFRISEYSMWGTHSWSLCLVICPLPWVFATEEGYWKRTVFTKTAWKSMGLFRRLESGAYPGKRQKLVVEKLVRKQIRRAVDVSVLKS